MPLTHRVYFIFLSEAGKDASVFIGTVIVSEHNDSTRIAIDLRYPVNVLEGKAIVSSAGPLTLEEEVHEHITTASSSAIESIEDVKKYLKRLKLPNRSSLSLKPSIEYRIKKPITPLHP